MEDIISNKCKNCKLLKIGFEEKENNMLNDENLKDFQAVLDSADKALDSIECVLDRELEIRGEETKVEPKIPINKYGLGQTLYLPVKIVGIRSRKTPNGNNIVLYDFSTTSDQRIGFKIFENASDIWQDKGHYMVSLPEEYIRDHFKEG